MYEVNFQKNKMKENFIIFYRFTQEKCVCLQFKLYSSINLFIVITFLSYFCVCFALLEMNVS